MKYLLVYLIDAVLICLVVTSCPPKDNPKHTAVRHRWNVSKAETETLPTPPPNNNKIDSGITGDKTGILVSESWIRRYKALEAKYETIPEDGKIYMEGEQYRIPFEVASHFSKMVRAED